MSVNAPLSSAAFYTPALNALRNASNELGNSTQRLSSGNRLVNAADDVAAFSISAGLQSQLVGLKQASSNVAQGSSLLQVASGGLTQITDQLNALKTLSIQATSASLTNTERAFLQQQFATTLASIDTTVNNTSFNGISLIDGTLAGGDRVSTQNATASKASGSFTLTGNPSTGQTVVLNGVTLTADTDFTVGGSSIVTATNLANTLNSSTDTRLSQATYEASGSTITIRAKSGGALGNQFVINQAGSTAAFTTSGGSTGHANIYTLSGGADDGLSINSIKASGSIGDTLVTTQSQVAASRSLTVTGTVSDGETLVFDNGNGGNITFTFRTTAALNTEVQIGASTEETLQNIISTVANYAGTDTYGLRQFDFSVNSTSLTITNKTIGNATDVAGAALDISETLVNGTLSGASFGNGTNTGVSVAGVNNPSFIGTISGFTASYNSADNVTASVTVGSSTYSASITDTTPATSTTVRFSSTSGGYFDVQLAGTLGQAVGNQTQADSYASRLNAAFSSLTFYQERPVTSFTAAGNFAGASAKLQLGDFTSTRINKIEITAPTATDGTIDITINGDIFRANTGLGGKVGAFETVKFTNVDNSNETLTIKAGTQALDFSTSNAASTLEDAFRSAFNLDDEGEGTDFQVGPNVGNVINVSISSATADSLFGGGTPSISTIPEAQAAQTSIDAALNTVKTISTNVGALQSSFMSAASNLNQSIVGITAANSALVDTDIAVESTNFAMQTVKVNAGVAVIAQALSLQSSLLGVLRSVGNS